MQQHFFLFRTGEKIYAVWSFDDYPSYNFLDRYDAGPDGLSGKKEGFYFANQLLPFTVPIQFNGVIITPDSYPPCFDANEPPCHICTFFVREKCPIFADFVNFNLTRAGFDAYRKLIPVPRGWILPWSPNRLLWQRRSEQLRLLFIFARNELLLHGRPLHYKLLAKLIQDRHLEITISERKLRKILKINPIFFRSINDEVFSADYGIEPKFDGLFELVKSL